MQQKGILMSINNGEQMTTISDSIMASLQSEFRERERILNQQTLLRESLAHEMLKLLEKCIDSLTVVLDSFIQKSNSSEFRCHKSQNLIRSSEQRYTTMS